MGLLLDGGHGDDGGMGPMGISGIEVGVEMLDGGSLELGGGGEGI